MGSRLVRFIVIGVIAAGLGVWRASSRWSTDADDTRKIVMDLVKDLDCYDANKSVIDQCADRAHKNSFASAYKPAGRYRSSDIDGDKYLDGFFKSLADQFDLLNRQDLKKCLSDSRKRWNESTDETTKPDENKQ